MGIDPSMTATGIVLLKIESGDHLQKWKVKQIVHSETVRTYSHMQLPARLAKIHNCIGTTVADCAVDIKTGDLRAFGIVIENPSDFKSAKDKRNPQTIALLGMATGVAIHAASMSGRDVIIIGSKVWYPTEQGRGGRRHMMKKDHVIAFLQRGYGLQSLNEHCTMAVGVVMYHLHAQDRKKGGQA